MHKAVFSHNERKIIETYLATGKQLAGFRTLKSRVNKHSEMITEDYQLMNRLKARLALEELQAKEEKEK